MSLKSNKIAYCKTPIGTAELTANSKGLLSVKITDVDFESVSHEIPRGLSKPVKQLTAYFYGDLKKFDLKLNLKGTKFQQKVWNEVSKIPYGKTVSYNYVAKKINAPKAARAVGNANGKNPCPIIVPCHRVIRKNGSLGGYSSGEWRKIRLINFESHIHFINSY